MKEKCNGELHERMLPLFLEIKNSLIELQAIKRKSNEQLYK